MDNTKDASERSRLLSEGSLAITKEGYVHPKKEVHVEMCGDASLPAPHLACTRALGHIYPAILPSPHVDVTALTPRDRFLILVTDGVTDRVEARDAMNVIADANAFANASHELVQQALALSFGGDQDNTSAVVVSLM